jgi:(p)ppGpp synthase/HD superfamily hydrolase
MERPNFADYFEINMIEWFNYKKTENKKEMTNMNEVDCWQLKFKSCTYSNALLNKLSLINEQTKEKINFLEIKKAIYYAQKYHGTQTRQSGEPYYMHPLMVAEMVAPHCFKTDILVVSILHDTLEDTVLTKDMLEYIFDANVASKVDDLTRVKSDRKISSAEMLELLWLQKKYDLLLVKYFDRLHNIQTINAKTEDKQRKIIKESLKEFLPVAAYLGMLSRKENIIEHWIDYTTGKPHIKAPVFSFQDNYQPLSLILQSETTQRYNQVVLEA